MHFSDNTLSCSYTPSLESAWAILLISPSDKVLSDVIAALHCTIGNIVDLIRTVGIYVCSVLCGIILHLLVSHIAPAPAHSVTIFTSCTPFLQY